MRLTQSIASCAVSLALTAAPALSQTAAPGQGAPAGDAAPAARTELEGKALKLLEEIGAEAQSLKLAENRVRVQSAAADLLWTRDEKAARELFAAAAAGVAASSAALAPDDPRYYQSAQETLALRRELMQVISQRDPKVALDFVRATRLPPPPPVANVGANHGYYQPDPEIALETALAEQIAVRDPKQALRLAEESLARGVSSNLVTVLERARATDPEGAARLASEIARRIRGPNLAGNYDALNVAGYLLRLTRAADTPPAPGPAGPVNAVAGSVSPVNAVAGQRPFQMDETARREMVVALVTAALGAYNDPNQRGNAQNALNVLREFAPEIERYAPQQAAAMRSIMPELQQRGGQAAARGGDAEIERQLRAAQSVDAMLEIASRAPAEMRPNIYRGAAYRALNEGAFERARQIVSTNFENAQEREQLLRELEQQMFWRAASRGDVDQALALLPRTRTPQERAALVLQLARTVAGLGNREAALRLLGDVWAQSAGRALDQSQFALQLEVAQVYAQLGDERAFQIAEAGIGRLNELLAAAAVVDGFGHDAFDQDELKPQGGYVWFSLIQQLGEPLAALARADFERAVAVADLAQRPEVRLRLRLAVARGVLAPANQMMDGPRRGRYRELVPLVRPR